MSELKSQAEVEEEAQRIRAFRSALDLGRSDATPLTEAWIRSGGLYRETVQWFFPTPWTDVASGVPEAIANGSATITKRHEEGNK
jgi:hypothetical protein